MPWKSFLNEPLQNVTVFKSIWGSSFWKQCNHFLTLLMRKLSNSFFLLQNELSSKTYSQIHTMIMMMMIQAKQINKMLPLKKKPNLLTNLLENKDIDYLFISSRCECLLAHMNCTHGRMWFMVYLKMNKCVCGWVIVCVCVGFLW